jgi:phosphoribosylpyrophosphate synthetase
MSRAVLLVVWPVRQLLSLVGGEKLHCNFFKIAEQKQSWLPISTFCLIENGLCRLDTDLSCWKIVYIPCLQLAPRVRDRMALILDPMLATGGTLIKTISGLKKVL